MNNENKNQPFSLHLLPWYTSFQYRSDHMQRWYSCNLRVLQTQLDKWLGHISPSVETLDQRPEELKRANETTTHNQETRQQSKNPHLVESKMSINVLSSNTLSSSNFSTVLVTWNHHRCMKSCLVLAQWPYQKRVRERSNIKDRPISESKLKKLTCNARWPAHSHPFLYHFYSLNLSQKISILWPIYHLIVVSEPEREMQHHFFFAALNPFC